jgi:hypothetical protein
MDTSGAFAATLDAEMSRLAVERVAFVKLDVDGHECDVLEGAQATLTRDRPPILMELAPYVFSERAGDFDRMLRLIWALGYRLFRVSDEQELPSDPDAIRAVIPAEAGINVVARTR